MNEVTLTKRQQKTETKPIFVSPEIHEKLKQLAKETNITMGEIAEIFISNSIENVVIKQGEQEA